MILFALTCRPPLRPSPPRLLRLLSLRLKHYETEYRNVRRSSTHTSSHSVGIEHVRNIGIIAHVDAVRLI